MYWLVDFDDTLVSGLLTWGLERGFPHFVAAHQLPCDEEQLKQLLYAAQEISDNIVDPRPLLDNIFLEMGWPQSLEGEFFDLLQADYRPTLFPETLTFLQKLRQNNQKAYLLSNNPRSTNVARSLGIGDYFVSIFTSQTFTGHPRKPSRLLWESILSQQSEIDPEQTVIVGDDPWSDGLFADNCNLSCWLLDRHERFMAMRAQKTYRWVQSLLGIVVPDSYSGSQDG